MVTVALSGGALAVAVVVGLLAHEWMHALVLRVARIDYKLAYFPGSAAGFAGILAGRPWAVVHPQPRGHEPAWILRVAALAPLALAVPVFAVGAGFVSPVAVPVDIDTPIATAIAIGWLACAIPSPQDFSVAFYAHRALETATDSPTVSTRSRAD
ncbi:hypothetical protein C482_08136 [Natrialba chahannaoensis JCM 10990]|uniref:DUF3267 domain-containing protein n=1 Tax=Natrialba chahannaoensis JCM 10990 TaxID=1227492 RepID=M0AS53_9EURY|nr:hypothetical protein C482_08136 [Natrialba chahannaoensis JCM 10990]